MNKTNKAEIVVDSDGILQVDYIDRNHVRSTFWIESLKDIECLKKELIEAGYIKAKEHWQK